MKINIKYLFPLVFIFLFNACSGDSLEIVGKVRSFDQNGFKCWFVVDESTGFNYELLSPDDFLLTEGRKVKIRAKPTNRETVCKVGDRIEILSYKLAN